MTTENLENRGLPKWPQMIVTGVPVTVAQAKEIIRRTDTFFSSGYGGNNHKFEDAVKELSGIPIDPWDSVIYDSSDEDKDAARAAVSDYQDRREAWRRDWGCIETSYVRNTWVAAAFIGGPYGWCHPDGQIGFIDNVGKYPSIEEVKKDWEIIAAAFPFLEIGVTLMDGESCEDDTKPVVSIRISKDKVTLHDPLTTNVHEGHPTAVRRAGCSPSVVVEFMKSINAGDREQGLPVQWFVDWARQYNPTSATLAIIDSYDDTPRLGAGEG